MAQKELLQSGDEIENGLKLTGDKINLLFRPANTATASSRCALLGKGLYRPISAVPLLNIYEQSEFDTLNLHSKRPFSAKELTTHSLNNSSTGITTSSIESSEVSDIDKVLSSSDILKTLLDEPVTSWRDGIPSNCTQDNVELKTNKIKDYDFASTSQTMSLESDTSNSIESFDVKAHVSVQKCEKNLEDNIESQTETLQTVHSERSMALIPGVKSKPPLSKKQILTKENIARHNKNERNDYCRKDTDRFKPSMQEVDRVFKVDNVDNASKLDEFLTDNLKMNLNFCSDKEYLDNCTLSTKAVACDKESATYLAQTSSSDDIINGIEDSLASAPKSHRVALKNNLKVNGKITDTYSEDNTTVQNSGTRSDDNMFQDEQLNFDMPELGSGVLITIDDFSSQEHCNEKHKQSEKNVHFDIRVGENSNSCTKDSIEPSQTSDRFSDALDNVKDCSIRGDLDTQDIPLLSINMDSNLYDSPKQDRSLPQSEIDPTLNKNGLKFQNWMEEEKFIGDDITEIEHLTNSSLEKLNIQEKRYTNKEENFLRRNKTSVDLLSRQTGTAKSTALKSARGFEEVYTSNVNHNNNSANLHSTGENSFKNPIAKGNPQLANNTGKANSGNIVKENYIYAKRQPKFVAKRMKSDHDYVEKNPKMYEVESWMAANEPKKVGKQSKNHRNINRKNGVYVPSATYEGNEASRSVNYLDFLSKVEELQECTNDNSKNLRQHGNISDRVQTNDGNTYDDIVSILQVLEDEDKKSHRTMHNMKKVINNELYNNDDSITEQRDNTYEKVTSSKLREEPITSREHTDAAHKDGAQTQIYSPLDRNSDVEQNSSISLSVSPNLNELFSFLDQVDRSCANSLISAKERVHSTTQIMASNIRLDTIPKLDDLLSHTSVELSHQIIDLTLRLKEKASSIQLLQNELSCLRQQVTKITKQTDEIVKLKLKSQKEECESIVKRHQKFIDQLIADKKTLNQQCEGLIHEMKVLEDRYNSNLKAAEHKHKVELQKVKEMQVAGEKYRRERWIDTKTQKIKELTVKGLEPELEKMAARHQRELSDLRSLHKREIEDLELRAARKTQQQCEVLRAQLTAEHEKTVAHERDIMRQRYEQFVESEEKNFQEQRRRLIGEHAHRISECEERENMAASERDKAIRIAKGEFEEQLQVTVRRHNTELNLLKEKSEMEMEAFRNSMKKKVGLQISEKEAALREKFKRERDREIEVVIERLEVEANEAKIQIEQATDNRVRRLKEKYENEIRDLEVSETDAKSKHSCAKTKLRETEEVIISLKASIKQLETQLQNSRELSDKLSGERSRIKEIVKQETKSELATLQKEVEIIKTDRDRELQQVYARVKVAVARKDETLSELSQENAALQQKCAYLENMLEQQRKEYLVK